MGFATSTTDPVCKHAAAPAFTLAESLIASVVLAVAAVAIVGPIMASRQQTGAADTNSAALALARQLIEEIAAKPLMNPDGTTSWGPSAGQTSRSQYNSVGNYNGYVDVSAGMTMLNGTAVNLPAGTTYSRTVAVEYRSSPAGLAVVSGDYAMVTVTVNPSNGPSVRLSQLLTRVPLKRNTNS
jgi:Tfp pilus assembly protein PilV